MSKYINADEFLHYYGILIHRPDFSPQSGELEAWKVWKKWFDEEIRLLVSKMVTEKNDEEKFLARIKDIPVLPVPSADVVEVEPLIKRIKAELEEANESFSDCENEIDKSFQQGRIFAHNYDLFVIERMLKNDGERRKTDE